MGVGSSSEQLSVLIPYKVVLTSATFGHETQLYNILLYWSLRWTINWVTSVAMAMVLVTQLHTLIGSIVTHM